MKKSYLNDKDYLDCVSDLIGHEKVCSMQEFNHHVNMSCLEHSYDVSYRSYKLCRLFKFDYVSAARGGLLHDFFLYDWHGTGVKNLHGMRHPHTALYNANKYFDLNKIEKDIIKKHMWPLTLSLPRYKETIAVILIDKYCTCVEVVQHLYNNKVIKR